MAKNLILYYSRKGQNYFSGSIRDVAKGNTEYVAEFIRDSVGGDLFEIDTVEPYPIDYMQCTEVAKDELRSKKRPALKNYIGDISEYDNIFVCGPCWWGTFPMPVFTQLEKLDWKGKKVFPVMTHEGSGLGSSERDLKNACTGATVGKGLSIGGGQASSSQKKVADWAKKAIE